MEKKRILVSDPVDSVGVEILRQEGYTVDVQTGIPEAKLREIVGNYHGLVVRSETKVTGDIVEAARMMKVIGRAGTGVDNIDVDAATRRGILVMNTPGGNTISAAEHTVSMMLALARNIPQAHVSLTGGKWERKKFVGMEVSEKTIGIIGLGKIGREVARRCQGLEMHVLGFDPLMQNDVAARLGIELVPLEQIFRRSDFITVHTPLTNETHGLINDESLGTCKRGVRIINCARGGIVDEDALLRALESGQAGGAALDVFEEEPPEGGALFANERVIVTPHLGASTEEAQEKVAAQIARQLADALEGRAYAGVVNASILQMTINEDVRPFLTLSEKLGSLAVQMSGRKKIRQIMISGDGDLVVSSLDLLKAGVLKGILSHLHPDPVNIINAPLLAKEMGVVVREMKHTGGREFLNSLALNLDTESGPLSIEGTVFGASSIRLVKMDGYRIEVNPEGYLLIYRNLDKPGFLARVGSILASANVNIAGVSLGRSGQGEMALTMMNIDDPIPTPAVAELAGLEGVLALRIVRL